MALREGEKKEAEHLRKDLSELGIVIRDQGYHQYFRKVKK
ncbi:CysS/YqeB C-terminal domain-containing protein [Lentibacillus halodurans]